LSCAGSFRYKIGIHTADFEPNIALILLFRRETFKKKSKILLNLTNNKQTTKETNRKEVVRK